MRFKLGWSLPAKLWESPLPTAVGLAGFAGALAQILILRELLALFHGNEVTTAAALGFWLLGTAVGSALGSCRSGLRPPSPAVLVVLLLLLAAMLPGGLLIIRGARRLWQTNVGELLTPLQMFVVAGGVAGGTGGICGALFARAWAQQGQARTLAGGIPPLAIYLAEALGAALAGPLFLILLLARLTSLQISLGADLLLVAAAFLVLRSPPAGGRRLAAVCWLALLALAAIGGVQGRLERLSRTWQWGPHLVASQDTFHHNLTLLHARRQWSLFADGVWWFSQPDRQSEELDVLLPLVEHPSPRALLMIGGCGSDRPGTALEHPGIERIDCLEPDPGVLELVRRHLPQRPRAPSAAGPPVEWRGQDPRSRLSRDPSRYDVVLMALGEPLNAGMNRFYSLEFYELLKQRLNPGGILAFSLPSGEDMVGSGQSGLLRTFHRGLRAVFDRVLVVPGDQALMLAGSGHGAFLTDAEALDRRIRERRLNLRYLNRERLGDLFSPLRLRYLESVLAAEGARAAPISRDFLPTCYRSALMLWTELWPGGPTALARRLLELPATVIPVLVTVLGAALVIGFRLWPKPPAAIRLAVVSTGMLQLMFQVFALIGYQILLGFLYARLALLISAFMAGMAAGAGWVKSRPANGEAAPEGIRTRLLRVQGLMVWVVLLLLGTLVGLHPQGATLPESLVSALWCLITGAAGALGGAHFALAAQALQAAAPPGPAGSALGGRLYALDVFGAMIGALTAAAILLPVHGLIGAVAILAGIALVTWLFLATACSTAAA